MGNIKINFTSIQKKIEEAGRIKAAPIANKKVLFLFKRAKEAMLKEFDSHPITLELRKGARAVPVSDATDGYGNLFSFIGFEGGTDPISPIRELLEASNIQPTIYRNKTWYFRLNSPSKKAIESASPMPWEVGNSWVHSVENGISNLSHYLYKKSKSSRSGWGIQTPWEINDDLEFQPTPYLTEILKNFRERINNI